MPASSVEAVYGNNFIVGDGLIRGRGQKELQAGGLV